MVKSESWPTCAAGKRIKKDRNRTFPALSFRLWAPLFASPPPFPFPKNKASKGDPVLRPSFLLSFRLDWDEKRSR